MIPSDYLLLFTILAFGIYFEDLGISVNLAYLSIPLSACLARRYSWQGVLVIAQGGLLLPIGLRKAVGAIQQRRNVS